MKKTLDAKDKLILAGKLAGKNSKQIAAEVFPDSPNGDVAVRKRLQKATMRDAVNAELLDEGVTLKEILSPTVKALRAKIKHHTIETEVIKEGNKTITKNRDVVMYEEDNIPLQLQGHDRLVKLTGLDKMHDTEVNTPPLDEEELKELASTSDEIELTRILFKKNT